MITPEKFENIKSLNLAGGDFERMAKCAIENIPSAISSMERLLSDRKAIDILKKQAPGLLKKSPWVDSGFGIYFATVANMKTTFGPRIMPTVDQAYQSSWENTLEIGSGVGFIEPWQGAFDLLNLGQSDRELMINYDSPGGRYPSRWAAATILNSQISQENALRNPVFTFKDIYITPSSTAAIDTVFEAFSQMSRDQREGKNRVVILGPSYYVLAFSAQNKDLPITRISRPQDITFDRRIFLPSIAELANTMTEDTGMIVLTLPNNPNGETYTNEELTELFTIAKQKRVFVLIDQVFEQLYFDTDNKPNPLTAAIQADSLDQLIIVDALSKSQNLAGIRLGWIATKNSTLERYINRESIARVSNPQLTIEPLLQFEAMARIIDSMRISKKTEAGVNLAVETVRQDLKRQTGEEWLEKVDYQRLTEWYTQRRDWLEQTMIYYRDNLALIQFLVDQSGLKVKRSPDQSAYNTFLGFSETNKNQGFDKILKLFLFTGVVAMSGQCFGQPNPENEFWTRITYGGLARNKIPEAMARLFGFIELWDRFDLGNAEKLPVIDTKFAIT